MYHLTVNLPTLVSLVRPNQKLFIFIFLLFAEYFSSVSFSSGWNKFSKKFQKSISFLKNSLPGNLHTHTHTHSLTQSLTHSLTLTHTYIHTNANNTTVQSLTSHRTIYSYKYFCPLWKRGVTGHDDAEISIQPQYDLLLRVLLKKSLGV